MVSPVVGWVNVFVVLGMTLLYSTGNEVLIDFISVAIYLLATIAYTLLARALVHHSPEAELRAISFVCTAYICFSALALMKLIPLITELPFNNFFLWVQ